MCTICQSVTVAVMLTARLSGPARRFHSELYSLDRRCFVHELPKGGFALSLLLPDIDSWPLQILDLKGTPKSVQNNLLDSFLSITSTKTDLESTSFLSSLDMDPPTTASHITGGLISPGGSRIGLPTNAGGDGSGSIFAGFSTPPQSGPATGSSLNEGKTGDGKQVLSDIRRFMSFGLRKESGGGP